MDPFGYYAEGIQLKLDDAFVAGEQGPEGGTPLASPLSGTSDRPAESSAFKSAQPVEESPTGVTVPAEAESLEQTQVCQLGCLQAWCYPVQYQTYTHCGLRLAVQNVAPVL